MEAGAKLPDRTICRTENYLNGANGLYKCLVENPFFCRYSLSFGYSFYFCYHEDRMEYACLHPASSASPGPVMDLPPAGCEVYRSSDTLRGTCCGDIGPK
jgi:hypothetical protein